MIPRQAQDTTFRTEVKIVAEKKVVADKKEVVAETKEMSRLLKKKRLWRL